VKNLVLSRYALSSLVAAAMLAGCAGSQPVSPSVIRSDAKVARGSRSSGDLLYVSNRGNKPSVQVFDYPSGKPVETIKDPAFGLCSNASGDVFAVDYVGTINWYSHDGTKIGELGNDPGYPQSCAVDPTTGNLAVAGAYKNVATANVEVFPWQGSSFGSPTTYTDSSVSSLIWCAYDDGGNLFANASVGSNGVALDELPSGGSSLKRISVNHSMSGAGAIQWDGQYLAMANYSLGANKGPATIYQLQITGSSATVKNTIKLESPKNKRNSHGPQLWIQDGTILYPESDKRNVGLWNYPSGGKQQKTIKVHSNPWGVTVSIGS
jgi:hypothetical protein